MERKTIGEILKFGIVGVIATVIHYGIYFLLQSFIDVNVAFTLGYGISLVANYILSARFTFRKKTSVKNGIGFGGAHLINYLLQMCLLNLFLGLGVDRALAPFPVYCISIPVNFMMVRFAFRRRK